VQLGASKQPPKASIAQAEVRDLAKEFQAGRSRAWTKIVFAVARSSANTGTRTSAITLRKAAEICTATADASASCASPTQSHHAESTTRRAACATRSALRRQKDGLLVPQGGTEHYHLYEINVDGTGLKQLTDGEYDDIEPSYLADGGIVFVSSRCKRWVNCWLTQWRCCTVATPMARTFARSPATTSTTTRRGRLPTGAYCNTRWSTSIAARSITIICGLSIRTVEPVGLLRQHAPGLVMIDAKPIPNSDKILCNFSPGHGRTEHEGALTVLDPNGGPDAQPFATRITKKDDFRDPYPLSESAFLAARHQTLVLVDAKGSTQEIFKLSDADIKEGLHCHEPRPICVRQRERTIAPRVDLSQPTGRLLLADVTYGRNMEASSRRHQETAGARNAAQADQLYRRHGPAQLRRHVLAGTHSGTVPVEADGSAYFEVPALRSVFFVALDETIWRSSACRASSRCSRAKPRAAPAATSSASARRATFAGPLEAARRAPSRSNASRTCRRSSTIRATFSRCWMRSA